MTTEFTPTEIVTENGEHFVRRPLNAGKEIAFTSDMSMAEFEAAKAAGLRFVDASTLDDKGRITEPLASWALASEQPDPIANAKALAERAAPKPPASPPILPGAREWTGREWIIHDPAPRKHSMDEIAAMPMEDFLRAQAAGEI